MADAGYVDYSRRGKPNNPFNDSAEESEGFSSDAEPRGRGRGAASGLAPIGETSEPHPSSGTEFVDYGKQAQRMQQGAAAEPAVTSDDQFDDAYVGNVGSTRGSRSQRSKPSDPSVPTRSHFSADTQNAYNNNDQPFSDSGESGQAANRRSWRRGEAGAPPSGPNVLSDHVVPLYGDMTTMERIILEIKQATSFAGTALSFNFMFFIAIGSYLYAKVNPKHVFPKRAEIDNAWLRRIPGERYSSRTEYYCEFWGYDCEAHDVETEDGFMLRMYHVVSRRKSATPGPPVLIQHGILCNSANFVVNEERSMAFWFVEQGYDVWLGNIRTNLQMPHRKFERWDPRYWAWAFKEIGIYDCTASVEYVYEQTGQKVNYVGHSQGGGTMFLALSHNMRPDIGEKMASFCALAPAIYAGEVLHTFPFSLLRLFKSRPLWNLAFGQREFFPVLGLLQEYIPGWLFGHLAIPVFFFLFGFHDHNWVPRQVPKLFRTTPTPTSAELLYFYMGNFSYNMCVFDESAETWFPPGFPPLGLWYGDIDTLVDGRRALERLRTYEKDVPLDVAYELHNHEHLDMIWGVNVVEECFIPMLRFIEAAGNRAIEEGRATPARTRSVRSQRSARSGSQRAPSRLRESEVASAQEDPRDVEMSERESGAGSGVRSADRRNAFI